MNFLIRTKPPTNETTQADEAQLKKITTLTDLLDNDIRKIIETKFTVLLPDNNKHSDLIFLADNHDKLTIEEKSHVLDKLLHSKDDNERIHAAKSYQNLQRLADSERTQTKLENITTEDLQDRKYKYAQAFIDTNSDSQALKTTIQDLRLQEPQEASRAKVRSLLMRCNQSDFALVKKVCDEIIREDKDCSIIDTFLDKDASDDAKRYGRKLLLDILSNHDSPQFDAAKNLVKKKIEAGELDKLGVEVVGKFFEFAVKEDMRIEFAKKPIAEGASLDYTYKEKLREYAQEEGYYILNDKAFLFEDLFSELRAGQKTPQVDAYINHYKDDLEALNRKNKNGATLLLAAAAMSRADIVKRLLVSGAAPDIQNDNGDTPLHRAAEVGHKEIVEMLIDNGANVNARDDLDNTPLHLAAEAGHIEVVKALLDAGADSTITNSEGHNEDIGELNQLESKHSAFKVVLKKILAQNADANPLLKKEKEEVWLESTKRDAASVLSGKPKAVQAAKDLAETTENLSIYEHNLHLMKLNRIERVKNNPSKVNNILSTEGDKKSEIDQTRLNKIEVKDRDLLSRDIEELEKTIEALKQKKDEQQEVLHKAISPKSSASSFEEYEQQNPGEQHSDYVYSLIQEDMKQNKKKEPDPELAKIFTISKIFEDKDRQENKNRKERVVEEIKALDELKNNAQASIDQSKEREEKAQNNAAKAQTGQGGATKFNAQSILAEITKRNAAEESEISEAVAPAPAPNILSDKEIIDKINNFVVSEKNKIAPQETTVNSDKLLEEIRARRKEILDNLGEDIKELVDAQSKSIILYDDKERECNTLQARLDESEKNGTKLPPEFAKMKEEAEKQAKIAQDIDAENQRGLLSTIGEKLGDWSYSGQESNLIWIAELMSYEDRILEAQRQNKPSEIQKIAKEYTEFQEKIKEEEYQNDKQQKINGFLDSSLKKEISDTSQLKDHRKEFEIAQQSATSSINSRYADLPTDHEKLPEEVAKEVKETREPKQKIAALNDITKEEARVEMQRLLYNEEGTLRDLENNKEKLAFYSQIYHLKALEEEVERNSYSSYIDPVERKQRQDNLAKIQKALSSTKAKKTSIEKLTSLVSSKKPDELDATISAYNAAKEYKAEGDIIDMLPDDIKRKAKADRVIGKLNTKSITLDDAIKNLKTSVKIRKDKSDKDQGPFRGNLIILRKKQLEEQIKLHKDRVKTPEEVRVFNDDLAYLEALLDDPAKAKKLKKPKGPLAEDIKNLKKAMNAPAKYSALKKLVPDALKPDTKIAKAIKDQGHKERSDEEIQDFVNDQINLVTNPDSNKLDALAQKHWRDTPSPALLAAKYATIEQQEQDLLSLKQLKETKPTLLSKFLGKKTPEVSAINAELVNIKRQKESIDKDLKRYDEISKRAKEVKEIEEFSKQKIYKDLGIKPGENAKDVLLAQGPKKTGISSEEEALKTLVNQAKDDKLTKEFRKYNQVKGLSAALEEEKALYENENTKEKELGEAKAQVDQKYKEHFGTVNELGEELAFNKCMSAIENKENDELKELLEKHPKLIDSESEYGERLLKYATAKNNDYALILLEPFGIEGPFLEDGEAILKNEGVTGPLESLYPVGPQAYEYELQKESPFKESTPKSEELRDSAVTDPNAGATSSAAKSPPPPPPPPPTIVNILEKKLGEIQEALTKDLNETTLFTWKYNNSTTKPIEIEIKSITGKYPQLIGFDTQGHPLKDNQYSPGETIFNASKILALEAINVMEREHNALLELDKKIADTNTTEEEREKFEKLRGKKLERVQAIQAFFLGEGKDDKDGVIDKLLGNETNNFDKTTPLYKNIPLYFYNELCQCFNTGNFNPDNIVKAKYSNLKARLNTHQLEPKPISITGSLNTKTPPPPLPPPQRPTSTSVNSSTITPASTSTITPGGGGGSGGDPIPTPGGPNPNPPEEGEYSFEVPIYDYIGPYFYLPPDVNIDNNGNSQGNGQSDAINNYNNWDRSADWILGFLKLLLVLLALLYGGPVLAVGAYCVLEIADSYRVSAREEARARTRAIESSGNIQGQGLGTGLGQGMSAEEAILVNTINEQPSSTFKDRMWLYGALAVGVGVVGVTTGGAAIPLLLVLVAGALITEALNSYSEHKRKHRIAQAKLDLEALKNRPQQQQQQMQMQMQEQQQQGAEFQGAEVHFMGTRKYTIKYKGAFPDEAIRKTQEMIMAFHYTPPNVEMTEAAALETMRQLKMMGRTGRIGGPGFGHPTGLFPPVPYRGPTMPGLGDL
ncbi:MAG: ankyrin repeat domain-containing protein [Rickettsiaceae bacterium]|nr:ankyrin repeat domain-containing protein [Rickettsiaceae bacterium]